MNGYHAPAQRYCDYCGRRFVTSDPSERYCDHQCAALAKWAVRDERYSP